jgi:uncharacterized OB-fold protein
MTASFISPTLVDCDGEDDRTAVVGNPVRLRASACTDCDQVVFPAMPTCPSCGRYATTLPLASRATLRGFTSVLHPPPGAEIATPYHVGVAEFAEGVAIMGILDIPDGHTPRRGDPIATVSFAVGEALTYAFRLVDGHR